MKNYIKMGAITLLSVAALAACANTANESTKLVTMKGDTITVGDFYEEIKTTQAAQQAMLSLTLSRVFEEQYGDKVSDDQVVEAYNKTADQYGEGFATALSSVGLTPETYKQEVRKNLLLDYAVEEAAKKELTDEVYQTTYESYRPEMTAQVILLASEDEAKAVLEQVKAEGADFLTIGKEKTQGKEVEYTFDSADTRLPSQVIEAAGLLEVNSISDVIPVTNQQTFTTAYYIIKTTEKTEKDKDWKTYKERLEAIFLSEKRADSTFQRQVIAAALEKANVKIKDEAFANILASYATTDASTTTSSSAE